MDKEKAIKIAQNYIEKISRDFKIENAILFGSYAKGTNHADSDIDIALVFKSVEDIIDRQIVLLNLRSDEDLLIEPHPFASGDFNNSNPVVHEILKDGITLKGNAA